MPLRRCLSLTTGFVCLLAALPGAPRLWAAPPAAAPAAAAVARGVTEAQLLRQAQPFLRNPASLPGATHAFPRSGAVQLYHLRYEQVAPDGLSALVVQHVYQVRTRAEAEMFALDNLWYDSARTRFHLVRAQVLRGSQVLHGRDGGNLRPHDSGNQPREVTLPPLRAGDRINVVYVLLPRQGPEWSILDGRFLGNLFAFRDSFPSVAVRYVLAAKHAMSFSEAGLTGPGVTHDGAWTRWSWTARDQPPFFHQDSGPSITDVSPFVQVSGFDSWAELADWYGRVLASRDRLTPKFQKRLVQIARPALTPAALAAAVSPGLAAPKAARAQATVARVWGYLSSRLSYDGNESGLHAYVPAPVEKVFDSGKGDCKDGALLLVTWLRAAGVPADLALVRTPSMGRLAPGWKNPKTGAAQAAATMAAFDHALVYLPELHQWLDTTAPDFLDGELPSSDQNSLALIVRPGQNELVRIPAASPGANLTRRSVRLTPLGGGWLRAEGSLEVRGADSPRTRSQYADPATRVKRMQRWLRNDFPHARVEAVQVSGIEPARDTVRIQFRARVRPQTFRAAWIERHYAPQLAAQKVRRTPLQVPLRWSLEETWSLKVGDSAVCERISTAPAVDQRGSFGRLGIRRECSHGWLRVHSLVTQDTERVKAGKYAAYRGFWRSVDARLDAPLPVAPQLLAALRAPASGSSETREASVKPEASGCRPSSAAGCGTGAQATGTAESAVLTVRP